MSRTSRKRPSACLDKDDNAMLTTCGGTRASIAKALTILTERKLLNVAPHTSTGTRAFERQLKKASDAHGEADTPYGKVLQEMPLRSNILKRWKFCHPMALMFYLCVISTAFADIMSATPTSQPLRIVIYIDEINPGNPLRPEKSRTLQAVYWCFADWPDWLLSRTAAWPTFGTLRSTVVESLPGGPSEFMKHILRVFWPPEGQSMATGFTIVKANGERLIRSGIFGGFLCDEKAHNQVVGCKGASGTKPCLTCGNVFGRCKHDDIPTDGVSIACPSYDKLKLNSNRLIFDIFDRIKSAAEADRELLQQQLGMNYNPDGILADMWIRSFYKPVDHMLRDWMHMLVSNGVCNREMAYLFRALSALGVTIGMVNEFVVKFRIPKRHGKVSPTWLSAKRLGKKKQNLQSFASDLVTLIPIVLCYLTEVVGTSDSHPLGDHVACLTTVWQIIGVCSLGAHAALEYVDLLRSLITKHHELYVRLYPRGAISPKFHQLLHICDNVIFLRCLLSCFVTERKHVKTKSVALHVFRQIDNTVITQMVHHQCEQIKGSTHTLFRKIYQIQPKPSVHRNVTYMKSTSAVLGCGSVHRDDIVYIKRGVVGKVVRFWGREGVDKLCVEVLLHRPASGRDRWTTTGDVDMVSNDDVIDTCTWAPIRDDIIRVIPPFKAYLPGIVA
jgi:hypothetical protein